MRSLERCRHQKAQGLVEAALALMLLVPLALGLVALLRLQQAQTGVDAVVYEAARAAVLANSSQEAQDLGFSRGQAIGPAYGLVNGTLEVAIDARPFGRGEPAGFIEMIRSPLIARSRFCWTGFPVPSITATFRKTVIC